MLGDFLIVVSHDGNGFADPFAELLERFETTHGRQIVGAENGIGPGRPRHQAQRRVAPAAGKEVALDGQSGIDRDPGLVHRALITFQSLRRSLHPGFARDESDLSVPLSDQRLGRRLSAAPLGGHHRRETVTVDLTEALGGVSYAYLTSRTGERMIVEERGDVRSREGDTVGIGFDDDRVYIFDRKSEAQLR